MARLTRPKRQAVFAPIDEIISCRNGAVGSGGLTDDMRHCGRADVEDGQVATSAGNQDGCSVKPIGGKKRNLVLQVDLTPAAKFNLTLAQPWRRGISWRRGLATGRGTGLGFRRRCSGSGDPVDAQCATGREYACERGPSIRAHN